MGESRDGNFIRESQCSVPAKHGTPISNFFITSLNPKTASHTTHTNTLSVSISVASVLLFAPSSYSALPLFYSIAVHIGPGSMSCSSSPVKSITRSERHEEQRHLFLCDPFVWVSNVLSRIEQNCVMGVVTSIPGGLRGVMK